MKKLLTVFVDKPYLFIPLSMFVQLVAVACGVALTMSYHTDRESLFYQLGIFMFGIFGLAPLLMMLGILFSLKHTNNKSKKIGLISNSVCLLVWRYCFFSEAMRDGSCCFLRQKQACRGNQGPSETKSIRSMVYCYLGSYASLAAG